MSTSHFTRRTLLKGLGVIALAGAAGPSLAACSGSAPEAGSPGPLSFLTWDTDSDSPLYTVAQDWAKSASTTIDIQSIPGGDEYEAKLRTVLASGAPPDSIRINDDYVKGY
jgi:multiple sugar transport system substrate-binding protein